KPDRLVQADGETVTGERRRYVIGRGLKVLAVDIRSCRIVEHTDFERIGAIGRSADILNTAQVSTDLIPLTVGYRHAVDRQVAATASKILDPIGAQAVVRRIRQGHI